MDHDEVRAGVTKADANKQVFGFFVAELMAIAWFVGQIAGIAIGLGVVVFILLLAMWKRAHPVTIPLTAALVGVVMFGISAGATGGGAAPIIAGIVAFLAALGIHASGFQYMADISRR